MRHRVFQERHQGLFVVSPEVAALAMTRPAGSQHAQHARAVVAPVNIVPQEDDNRRPGQAGIVDRARLQERNHVRQQVRAAVYVADRIAHPPVEKPRDGGFRPLEEPQHAHAAIRSSALRARNALPELRFLVARQP